MKTMLDRVMLTKCVTHRVFSQISYPKFQKTLSCQKWRPFGIFEFFAKIAKHKSAYILKTILDRAILKKFLTHMVSVPSQVSKKFLSPQKWRPF